MPITWSRGLPGLPPPAPRQKQPRSAAEAISSCGSPAPRVTSSRSAVLVLPLRELEVVPRHAAVLGAGIAEEERGVERRNQHGVAERMQPSAELADRFLRPQQRLRRHRAQREDDL